MYRDGFTLTPEILEYILDIALAGYWVLPFNRGESLSENSYEFLSKGWKSILGYEDHELENKAFTWMKLIHPDDIEKATEDFTKHVESKGKHPYKLEVRYRHKDGNWLYILCVGKVVMWYDDGSPRLMVGCHIDITDRKILEIYQDTEDLMDEFSRNIDKLLERKDNGR